MYTNDDPAILHDLLQQRVIPGEYVETEEAVEAAAAAAEAHELTVVWGKPNTLLVDLDDEAVLNKTVLAKLQEEFGPVSYDEWVSRSGQGKHYEITFHKDVDFTPAEAIALELALGSDPIRGLLGIRRIKNNVRRPRMLWRPKEA